MNIKQIQKTRVRRNYRARRKLFGSADRPRLCVFRSNRHIYVQIIDDFAGVTLVAASTRCKGVRDDVSKSGNKAAAVAVGSAIAKRALNVGIQNVCFDRNGYRFHGRVKALADAAREAGLKF
jgi:large subunit ribosomal protein L18